jgi:hypothetical protein
VGGVCPDDWAAWQTCLTAYRFRLHTRLTHSVSAVHKTRGWSLASARARRGRWHLPSVRTGELAKIHRASCAYASPNCHPTERNGGAWEAALLQSRVTPGGPLARAAPRATLSATRARLSGRPTRRSFSPACSSSPSEYAFAPGPRGTGDETAQARSGVPRVRRRSQGLRQIPFGPGQDRTTS